MDKQSYLGVSKQRRAHGSVRSQRSGTPGTNAAPFLQTYFPESNRPNQFEGYYKLASDSGDEMMFFATVMSNGVPVGQAFFVDSSNAAEYTHFIVPFMYSEDEPPDTAMILIEMENARGSVHEGSTFVVDDISFSGTAFNPFVSVHSESVLQQSFLNYPNPFSSSTTITFTSTTQSYAEVTVVNLLGTPVAEIFSGELEAGPHEFSWDAIGMAPGMYECMVRMNGTVQTIPILLSK